MKLTAWFTTLVGLLMLAQWTFFLTAGQVPELQTAPLEIAFHLLAEFSTAAALLVAGYGLFTRRPWARTCAFISLGMLLYTVLVSPGYFAQRANWPPVILFAVLLILALVCLRQLMQPVNSP